MSRCALNRWGPGTTCERPINTEASKELLAKIKAMQEERAKQDTIWTQATYSEAIITEVSTLDRLNDTPVNKTNNK